MKQKQSIEDYLKTIYILSKTKEVHGANIAEALNVTRPTVSVALKALEREGYVYLDQVRAVHLTELGKEIALQIYERHRTFHQLLLDLGVDKGVAEQDACRLEHAVSHESFAALKRMIESKA